MTGLWPAILADTEATVLVTANAMRLLRWTPRRQADPRDAQGTLPGSAQSPVEADPDSRAARPKLNRTGRGLSPAEYSAEHGCHAHQADFSRDGDGDGGDDRTAEAGAAGRADRL